MERNAALRVILRVPDASHVHNGDVPMHCEQESCAAKHCISWAIAQSELLTRLSAACGIASAISGGRTQV